jgi:nitrous oxide reductase accessory protein NosL
MQSVWVVVGGWVRGGGDASTVSVFSTQEEAEKFRDTFGGSFDWVEVAEKVVDEELV